MKICITATGDTLESKIDPRFGRCAYFLIVDLNTMKFEAFNNSQVQATGGAGIKSGQLITEKKVKAVLTGNVGPNAWDILKTADIEVITGVSGSVQDGIDYFKKGVLAATDSPTVKSHFGINESE